MKATEPIRPPDALEVFDEIVPMIGVVAGYGPPVIFLLGPWLLFGVMLAGPFAVLLTLVVLFAAAAALIALIGAILATPYLLVRHFREQQARQTSERLLAAQLVPVRSPRAGA